MHTRRVAADMHERLRDGGGFVKRVSGPLRAACLWRGEGSGGGAEIVQARVPRGVLLPVAPAAASGLGRRNVLRGGGGERALLLLLLLLLLLRGGRRPAAHLRVAARAAPCGSRGLVMLLLLLLLVRTACRRREVIGRKVGPKVILQMECSVLARVRRRPASESRASGTARTSPRRSK